MVYSLIQAFGMDDELLARRASKALPMVDMNGVTNPEDIHELAKSHSLASNGHSAPDIPNGHVHSPQKPLENELPMKLHVRFDYVKSFLLHLPFSISFLDLFGCFDGAQKLADWKIGFFDDLCDSEKLLILVKSLFCPCIMQYSNGRKVGLYDKPGSGQDLCMDVMWSLAVFVTPIAIIAMDFASIWQEGMVALSAVIWVAYCLIGASHRLKIREYYHLRGNPFVDVASYCCCYCLAVRQEYCECEKTVLL